MIHVGSRAALKREQAKRDERRLDRDFPIVSARIPLELYDRLKARADARGLAVEAIIGEALEVLLAWTTIGPETVIEPGDVLRREMEVDRHVGEQAPVDIDGQWRTRDEVNGWEKREKRG